MDQYLDFFALPIMLVCEMTVLIVFFIYTVKYVKIFKAQSDPFTIATFVCFGLSILIKILLKLPSMIIIYLYHESEDVGYREWVL
jgi:hypothetical protein